MSRVSNAIVVPFLAGLALGSVIMALTAPKTGPEFNVGLRLLGRKLIERMQGDSYWRTKDFSEDGDVMETVEEEMLS